MIHAISPNTSSPTPNFKGYRTGKKIAENLQYFKANSVDPKVLNKITSDLIERHPFSIKCYNSVNKIKNISTNIINKIHKIYK